MISRIDVTHPENWYIGRFCESKFFDQTALKNIHEWIDTQEWEDGLKTLNWYKDDVDAHLMKKNEATTKTIPSAMFWPYVDSNRTFSEFTHPRSSGQPMCTRTSVGGYYKPHFDDVTNGHFSTTIFLNDPDEYEGGELVLWIDGEERFFKPKAGEGVTYETGIGHRVNPVTKGERLALVFWTYCHWDNIDDFRDWRYYEFMSQYTSDDIVDTLDEYCNRAYTVLRNKANDSIRKHMRTVRPDKTL